MDEDEGSDMENFYYCPEHNSYICGCHLETDEDDAEVEKALQSFNSSVRGEGE